MISSKPAHILSKALYVCLLCGAGAAGAYDSGAKALGNAAGATDYYKIACTSAATDHFSIKIVDNTPGAAPPAQTLNLRIVKDALSQEAIGIMPGETREAYLQGGLGVYRVQVDAVGAGTGAIGRQTYKLKLQCLSASGSPTAAAVSKTGKLNDGKTAGYSVKCASKRSVGAADKLYAQLLDTTPDTGAVAGTQTLGAQVIHGLTAVNATDRQGDDAYGQEVAIYGAGGKNGSGDYFVTVDSDGTDPAQDKAKLYAFQYGCYDAAGKDTGEPVVVQLQDQ